MRRGLIIILLLWKFEGDCAKLIMNTSGAWTQDPIKGGGGGGFYCEITCKGNMKIVRAMPVLTYNFGEEVIDLLWLHLLLIREGFYLVHHLYISVCT